MTREVTPLTNLRENIILQEDKIFETWLGLVPPDKSDLAALFAEPVKDLLLLMYENLTAAQGEVEEEDTRHLAYRIAQQVLDEEPYQVLLSVFRDSLQEAVIEHTPLDAERMRSLLGFFNAVTDSYWHAHADNLRNTIRHQYREHVGRDLRVAKRVQQRLLPKIIPNVSGWEIAGRLVPALEVGGDYWSVKHYPDDDIITCKLADVTGHGIGAAILVAAVKFISGGFYRGAPSPSWVMERTNHVLVMETPSDIMVTMVYGWVRPATGEIDLVNAGHGPVFLCHEGKVNNIPPTGPALGLLESHYTEVKLRLQQDDVLFFCSDGVTEARSRTPAHTRESFGLERLHHLICENARLPAAELVDKVVQSAIDFAGTPTDDMSLMVIKRVSSSQ